LKLYDVLRLLKFFTKVYYQVMKLAKTTASHQVKSHDLTWHNLTWWYCFRFSQAS